MMNRCAKLLSKLIHKDQDVSLLKRFLKLKYWNFSWKKKVLLSSLMCYFIAHVLVWTSKWAKTTLSWLALNVLKDFCCLWLFWFCYLHRDSTDSFFIHDLLCLSLQAPIRDKTRKPKLLKPQPRKLILVSRPLPFSALWLLFSCISADIYLDVFLLCDVNWVWWTLAFTAGVFAPSEMAKQQLRICLSVKLCGTQPAFLWLWLTWPSHFLCLHETFQQQ